MLLFSLEKKSKFGLDDRPRESLTDMLEAFPPPAINNTSRDNPSDNQWPSPFANNAGNMHHRPNGPLKRQKSKSPEGRRCCGLPIWGFILLLLLLIILVAAAVLIPIFLIVLPNQQKANAACPNAFPCSNGGHSFTAPTGCRCICTSGFTGSQCARSPLVASDCTTANLQGLDQLTMGTKTLPLIVGASKYSIPLNSTILLSGFSFNKLSCGDENNLVTFLNTGSQQKRYLNPPAPTPVTALKTRADPPKIDAQSDSSLSSVVFDKSGTPTSSGAAPTATRPSTNQIGFAQTAVLYILQQNSLENANSMLNALDTAFHQGTWYGPIVVNSSIIVDLRLSKITMGGSSVGVGSK